jgi:hypothetical protein
MPKRLNVTLRPKWGDFSQSNPGGAPTFSRVGNEQSNSLQVSYAWYKGGAEPRPTDEQLIGFASQAFATLGLEGFSVVSFDINRFRPSLAHEQSRTRH